MLLDDYLIWKIHKHFCGNLMKVLSAFIFVKDLLLLNLSDHHLYYAFCFTRIEIGVDIYGAAAKACKANPSYRKFKTEF